MPIGVYCSQSARYVSRMMPTSMPHAHHRNTRMRTGNDLVTVVTVIRTVITSTANQQQMITMLFAILSMLDLPWIIALPMA